MCAILNVRIVRPDAYIYVAHTLREYIANYNKKSRADVRARARASGCVNNGFTCVRARVVFMVAQNMLTHLQQTHTQKTAHHATVLLGNVLYMCVICVSVRRRARASVLWAERD